MWHFARPEGGSDNDRQRAWISVANSRETRFRSSGIRAPDPRLARAPSCGHDGLCPSRRGLRSSAFASADRGSFDGSDVVASSVVSFRRNGSSITSRFDTERSLETDPTGTGARVSACFTRGSSFPLQQRAREKVVSASRSRLTDGRTLARSSIYLLGRGEKAGRDSPTPSARRDRCPYDHRPGLWPLSIFDQRRLER